ncbi:hypothetical protein CDAR_43531 [Caerostris darwini]|uniref:Uncharacterized protein n=1 Tax=Caerostris darwini TaxID=1538125 RepID=A0AAV4WJF9_9ARAC|nr:hypothetical protein CDAR_43531 [Caerostris darwini]
MELLRYKWPTTASITFVEPQTTITKLSCPQFIECFKVPLKNVPHNSQQSCILFVYKRQKSRHSFPSFISGNQPEIEWSVVTWFQEYTWTEITLLRFPSLHT